MNCKWPTWSSSLEFRFRVCRAHWKFHFISFLVSVKTNGEIVNSRWPHNIRTLRFVWLSLGPKFAGSQQNLRTFHVQNSDRWLLSWGSLRFPRGHVRCRSMPRRHSGIDKFLYWQQSVRESDRSSGFVFLTCRYQLELKDDYIARANKLIEDERKNKGDSGGKPYSALM